MPDISDLTHEQLPSSTKLLKSTLIAISVATLILLVAVLPAEYGIDLTGLGHKLGLTKLTNKPITEVVSTNITTPDHDLKNTIEHDKNYWISDEPLKSKTISLPLLPNQGAEIKAIMEQGQNFNYSWQATGKLYFDMHGEKLNAATNEFTSYWEEQNKNAASGNLVAPFSGTHGWYWENRTSELVEIKLEISGFFKDVYLP
jgi:hypothetical protein